MKHSEQFNYNLFEHKEKTQNPRVKVAKYIGGLALGIVLLAGSTGCSVEAKSPCDLTGEAVTISISEDARFRTQPAVEDGESSNRIANVEDDFSVTVENGDIHVVEDKINGDWIGLHASDVISADPDLASIDIVDRLSGDDDAALEKIAKAAEAGKSDGLVWVNTQKADVNH